MKNYFLIPFLLAVICPEVWGQNETEIQPVSQDVIAPVSQTFNGSNINMSFTIGEIAVGQVQDGEHVLHQGFQHPRIIVTELGFKNQESFAEVATRLEGLNAFPNPATQFVNVEFMPQETDLILSLTDLTGKRILSEIVAAQSNSTTIDVSGIANGLYIMELRNEQGTTVGRYKIHRSE